MKILRNIVAIAVLSTCLDSVAAGEDRPTFVFNATVSEIEGDLSLSPEGLAIGDLLSVRLSPADTAWEESYNTVLRDLSIEGDHIQLDAPARRVKLNNYSILTLDRPASGLGLGCFSDSDALGCSMGLWTNSPPYYSWSASFGISVTENPSNWPESARWPAYTRSAEAWNLNDAVRSFEIGVWEGPGNVGPPVLTITSEVGVVSLAVPEPSAGVAALTLAAAALRRRPS